MYLRDNWPTTPDGHPYDGKNLLKLVIDNKSPFDGLWDVRQLLAEIERNLRARIVDIPLVVGGSCHAVCYVSFSLLPFDPKRYPFFFF